MELSKVIKKRFSCRDYLKKSINKNDLQMILRAACDAPTALNRQPFKIKNVENIKLIENDVNLYGAPNALVICEEEERAWERECDKKNFASTDVGIVVAHMMLMATDLGINSVYVCLFEPEIIREKLGISKKFKVQGILALGYSDGKNIYEKDHLLNRKKIEHILI